MLMSRFLQTIILLASIICFSVLINVAAANEPKDEPPGQDFKTLNPDDIIIDPNPFYVQKPFLCQRGDSFISILEARGEYRAFIGNGQLIREDGTKIQVWIFTAVNFQTSTFTIFEWHSQGTFACILAIGKGFEILTDGNAPAQETIHIRKLLTL
tara:strand:- start:115 stop:579 length:465 start_codon:yes stop_codon:yes gene_type:complete